MMLRYSYVFYTLFCSAEKLQDQQTTGGVIRFELFCYENLWKKLQAHVSVTERKSHSHDLHMARLSVG